MYTNLSHSRPHPLGGLLATAFVLAACESPPLDTEPPPGAVQVSLSTTSAGFLACGAEVPVVATVTDDKGKRVKDFLLNFNVLAGGGSMFAGAALTDKDGIARDIWTLGATADRENVMAVRAVDPETGDGVTYADRRVTTLSRIAFGSRRDGSPDIYVVNPDGSGLVNLTRNSAQFDAGPVWSPDGSQIAFETRRRGPFKIFLMNADGSDLRPRTGTSGLSDEGGPTWSPDGSRIAFESNRDGGLTDFEIYVIDVDGTGLLRLTESPGFDVFPAWSPDGSRIAFVRELDDEFEIYVMNTDGSGQMKLTNTPGVFLFDPAWSPDGSRIAFTFQEGSQDAREIHVMNADGSGRRQLVDSPAADYGPTWSPDGSRIAFVSERDGGDEEIYVMNADGSGQTKLTEQAEVVSVPHWSGCVEP